MWKASRSWKAFALILALAAGVAHAKPTAPTIGQMAAFPKMSSFSVSRDGKHIAALEARGEDRVILVWETDGLNKPPTVIGSSKMKIRTVEFIKDDLLAVGMWQPYDARFDVVEKTFAEKLFITDLAGKTWKEPMAQEKSTSRFEEKARALSRPRVLNRLPNDPDHILVISDELSLGSPGEVFKVNVRTNRAERIQRSDEKVADYVVDPHGNLRARTRFDVDSKGPYTAAEIREADSGNWMEHFRSYVANRDVVEIVGFAKDPNIAFVRSNVGVDKTAIYEYDIAARKLKEVLFKHRFFDALNVSVNENKDSKEVAFGEITAIRYDGPRRTDVQRTAGKLVAIDKAIREALGLRQQKLRVTDPATGESAEIDYDLEATYSITSATPDYSTLTFTVSGASRTPEYYLLRDGKLTLLSKEYPEIDQAALGKTRLVYFKARDGLDIPAFLTTPDTELCGQAPWPAVVHPHGGPWSRDGMGFDSFMWIPLMASRCLAVLRPQFRGSAGWGRKLWMAGDAEWGQKMQDDKDDGAKWLVDQGIAQKGRIAIFGFSYGGYAAMAASVRPGGPFKCAIAGAGVSDHKRIWARFYTNPFFREGQSKTVDGLNPVDRADKLQIPIMVYHGDRDRTVPLEQSDWFVTKAKSANQPVVYHELADYGHGPAWVRKTRADELTYLENYLLKDCGGKGL